MENKDLLKLLEKMGLPGKTVHGTIEDSDVERIKNHLSLSRKEGVVEQRIKPTIIRRRVMREEAPPSVPEPAPPVEEKPPAPKKVAPAEVAKKVPEPLGKPAVKKEAEKAEKTEAPETSFPEIKTPAANRYPRSLLFLRLDRPAHPRRRK